MKPAKIKEQLLDYNRQFKRMLGSFESFVIIFDYINFLASEPYALEMLNPILDCLENEAEKLEKSNVNLENFSLDFSKPSGVANAPMFRENFIDWQKKLANKEDLKIMTELPIYLMLLIAISNMVKEIKDCQIANDIDGAKKLIEEIKEKSLSVIDTSMIKGIEIPRITFGKYADVCMELINKFIIDEIDSQALLDNAKPEAPLSFDKENSLLYIRGVQIQISRKSDKSIDHFILEAIFSNDDLTEQTDFVDISENFLKEDYDHNGQRFRHPCDNLNKKIAEATNNKITDFITYHTGKAGWCRINKEYL